jgi:hypothetical protein
MMRIKFGITKKEIQKKAIKAYGFCNFIMERYGSLNPPAHEYHKLKEAWRAMSKKEKDQYRVIQPDGSIRLDYATYEVRSNDKEKALAYQ